MSFGGPEKSRLGLGVLSCEGSSSRRRPQTALLDERRRLGRLGGSGDEASPGGTVTGAIRTAVLHYVRELNGGRAVPFPRFGPARDRGRALLDVDLSLDEETTTALEREAVRQQIGIEQLLVHAMLVYLADLDSAYAYA